LRLHHHRYHRLLALLSLILLVLVALLGGLRGLSLRRLLLVSGRQWYERDFLRGVLGLGHLPLHGLLGEQGGREPRQRQGHDQAA